MKFVNQIMEFIGKTLLVESGGKKILVIGDLHLGYVESLNRVGVLVSRMMFKDMIDYFDPDGYSNPLPGKYYNIEEETKM